MIFAAIKIVITITICIYASIEDIHHGIISNRVIIPAAVIGIILDIFEWVNHIDIFQMQIISILITTLISILLYLSHVWAGGDCKMMIALSFLLPSFLYDNQLTRIPLLTVLIIAFGTGYIYLVIDSFVWLIKKKDGSRNKKQIKDTITSALLNWIICVIYISAVHSIVSLLGITVFQESAILMITFNICMALIITKTQVLKKWMVLGSSSIISILLFLYTNNFSFSIKRIISFVVIIFAIILREFIDNYNYATIDTDSLKKGMILALTTTIMFTNSKIRGLPKQSTENLESRLTDEEVNAVKRWSKAKNVHQLVIVRKIPFAIFLSIGTLFFLFWGCKSW